MLICTFKSRLLESTIYFSVAEAYKYYLFVQKMSHAEKNCDILIMLSNNRKGVSWCHFHVFQSIHFTSVSKVEILRCV